MNEKLYTTPGDALRTAEVLGTGEKGRYLLAATFGNVHGVYKPGNVKLRPEILKELQDDVGEKIGASTSRSTWSSTAVRARRSRRSARRVGYGVVKMNVDTDTQYAFTREIAGHMFTNYDGVLKVDGEVGNKKAYDPRSYLKLAETGMAARVAARLRGPAVARARPPHRLTRGRRQRGRAARSARRVDLALGRAAQRDERGDAAGRDQHRRDEQARCGSRTGTRRPARARRASRRSGAR